MAVIDLLRTVDAWRRISRQPWKEEDIFRKFLAFVIAPFPVAFAQSLMVALWPKLGKGVFEHPLSMFVVICIYFYVFGVLIGIPARIFLRRRFANNPRGYVVPGLLVGLLPVVGPLCWMIFRGQASPYIIAYNLILFALGGAVSGWVIWKIVGRQQGVQSRTN